MASLTAASQVLKQDVCQRYGWSYEIVEPSNDTETEEEKVWTCTVIVGRNDRRTFTSTESKRHVCQVALQGLQEKIAEEEAKPVVSDFAEILPHPIAMYDSAGIENWEYFWRHKPSAVGIDTEGNGRSPPVLVQIATLEYIILEAPQENTLSPDLQRLLNDTSIVKVFCDNAAHRDKKCLGLQVNDSAHVVDLEALMVPMFGPVPSPRGLTRIYTLCHPELNVHIRKSKQRFSSSVGRFILIEQGKRKPLTSIYELTFDELQYAALDAYCTLQAYQRLMSHPGKGPTRK